MAGEIRKRLAELDQRLEVRLPVYLLLTKADLILGFETELRRPDECRARAGLGRHLRPRRAGRRRRGRAASSRRWSQRLEGRVGARMEGEEELATRAEIFRFPGPGREPRGAAASCSSTRSSARAATRRAPWLRGFYLTSATQEGTPIDRLVGALASTFGLPAAPQHARRRGSSGGASSCGGS